VYKIDYEQTDKKLIVEIYGIEFEVKKLDSKLLEEIKNIKEEELNNFDDLYKYVDMFIGKDASKKINDKRKTDGYDPMNYENILAIIELVFKVQEDKIRTYNDKYRNYQNRYNRRRRY